jgi:hypothetical protein
MENDMTEREVITAALCRIVAKNQATDKLIIDKYGIDFVDVCGKKKTYINISFNDNEELTGFRASEVSIK